MALIRHRKPALDNWQRLDAPADGAAADIPSRGDVIVPLAVWKTQRDALPAREGGLGVWLAGDDDPEDIAGDLARLRVVAVRFASFTDGRGYSIGTLLRARYGWRGELRAFGDVQRDQLFYLSRCGFDAFELRHGEDVETALGAFEDFSETYQASVEQPLPLFRRRQTAGSRA